MALPKGKGIVNNPNGRPKDEQKQYRKKLHRFSKFEDMVLDMVEK